MPRQKGQLAQVAEYAGCSKKHVLDKIKENPDLGIPITANVETVLDQNQINALCALLQREKDEKEAPLIVKYDENKGEIPLTNREEYETVNETELKRLREENAELNKKIAALNRDLGSAEGQLEAIRQDLKEVKDARDETQKALVASEAEQKSTIERLAAIEKERDEARDEATSFRKSIFGFYRKDKKCH